MPDIRFVDIDSLDSETAALYENPILEFINTLHKELHELDILLATRFGHPASICKLTQYDALSDVYTPPNTSATLLFVDGEPKAFVMHTREIPTYVSFWNLFVGRQSRNKRIGSMLITHCISKFRELGCVEASLNVHSNNYGALALYESFGFTPKMLTMSVAL